MIHALYNEACQHVANDNDVSYVFPCWQSQQLLHHNIREQMEYITIQRYVVEDFCDP